MDDLSTLIAASTNATRAVGSLGGPGAVPIDPQTIVASASGAPTAADAIGQATATQAYGSVTTNSQMLSTLSSDQQTAVWQSYTPQYQSQLLATGYKPPQPAQPAHSPPAGGLFNDIGGIFGDVSHGLSIAVRDVGGALGAGLRATQHVLRAGQYMGDVRTAQNQGDAAANQAVAQSTASVGGIESLFSGLGGAVRDLVSPHMWSQSWRATTNGESSFYPSVTRQLQKHTDPLRYSLAFQLASGIPQQQIVDSYPQTQRSQIAQMIGQDAELQATVAQLNASKISLGRAAVGEQFLLQHPTAGKFISGAIDAAFDVVGDPTLKAGAAVKAAGLVRWGLRGSDVARYVASDGTAMADTVGLTSGQLSAGMANVAQMSQVQRQIQHVGGLLETNPTMVQRLYPQTFGKVVNQLVQAGVNSPETLGQWMSDTAGMRAVLGGDAARLSHGAVIVPHLSTVGWATMKVKEALKTGLDQIIDGPKVGGNVEIPPDILSGLGSPVGLAADAAGNTPRTLADLTNPDDSSLIGSVFRNQAANVGRTIRRMSELTADRPYLDLAGNIEDVNRGAVNLRRMLGYSLPATWADQITNLYMATPDLGQRFNIAKGAVAQMLHLAGGYSTDANAAASDALLKAMDDSFNNEAYAPLGLDRHADGSRSAIFDGQQNTRISIPSFYNVRRAATADRVLRRLGIDIGGWANTYMQFWRPSVLLREGFPIRTSLLDETLGYTARNGVIPTVASRVAFLQARGDAKKAAEATAAATRAAAGLPPEQSKLADAAAIVAQHVPADILAKTKTGAEFAGAVLGEKTWQAFGKLDKNLSKQDYYDAATHFSKAWDAVSPDISAIHHAGGGYDTADELHNTMAPGGKVVTGRWVQKGKYSEVTAGDPLWRNKWQFSLTTLARSKLARAVLDNIDNPPQQQIDAVLNQIRHPDFADVAPAFKRNMSLPDGRQVGVDATHTEAEEAWAAKVVAATNALVRSSDPVSGELIRPVVDALRQGHVPSGDMLDQVDQHDLPKSVFGPDLVPVHGIQSILAKGMNLTAKQMDWLARSPNFMHAFTESRKELGPFVTGLQSEGEHSESLLNDLAAHQAMNKIKPYIHSPELKTQFEILHRTAMPFLFAQRQFLQRWTRTFADSPDAFRKAQLAMNGLQTSGFVHKDAQGNDVFYYPGSATLTRYLSDILNVFGVQGTLPINVPFTGQVKGIMPGLNNPLTPAVGPFVAASLKSLTAFEPALQPVDQGLLGPGAASTLWQQFVPSTLSRIYETFAANPNDTGSLFATSMLKAIADSEATGHGLPANATPEQRQQYLNRVTNWARINMFSTAILGFAMPASPAAAFDPKNLAPRLRELMGELPYNEALRQFLTEHPDASPYTVFDSQSAGGAQLPATVEAGRWLDGNAAFAAQYPQAAGWLIPQTTGSQPFDPAVYRTQIQTGMRDMRTPEEFLNAVQMAPAAQDYYTMFDAKTAALAAAKGNTQRTSQIRAGFDQWQARFMAQNPVFSDYLTSGASKMRREQTIRSLNDALQSPDLPSSAQTGLVQDLMTMFNTYQQNRLALLGNTSTSAKQTQTSMKDNLTVWATQFTAKHPEVSAMWTLLLRPELTDTTGGILASNIRGVAA